MPTPVIYKQLRFIPDFYKQLFHILQVVANQIQAVLEKRIVL